MNNYKLTAITFHTYELACDYVQDNIDNWISVEINGLKQSYEIILTNNEDITTVIFAKKNKKRIKEMSRVDCNNLIDRYGKDWAALHSNEVYTLEYGRNGKLFKGVNAKSWRGLYRIIKRLICENNSGSEKEFLRKYEIINYK